jgi:hypothetical protein
MNWPELESFMTDGIAVQGRQVNIMTGQAGMDMIYHSIAVSNAVDYVEWMLEEKKIEKDVAKSLFNMLESEDKDNFNIAILAIEQLKK